jgi:hypothetical protein
MQVQSNVVVQLTEMMGKMEKGRRIVFACGKA